MFCLQTSFPVFSVSTSHYASFPQPSWTICCSSKHPMLLFLSCSLTRGNFLPFFAYQNFIQPLQRCPNTTYHPHWRLPFQYLFTKVVFESAICRLRAMPEVLREAQNLTRQTRKKIKKPGRVGRVLWDGSILHSAIPNFQKCNWIRLLF